MEPILGLPPHQPEIQVVRFATRSSSGIWSRSASILLVVSAACLPGTAAAQPGQLDPSFGIGGKVTTSFLHRDRASAIAIQADGKIVVVGRAANASDPVSGDFAVARYSVNGAPDASFGAGGKVTTDFLGFDDGATAVAIQADGKIMVAGFASFRVRVDGEINDRLALARYDSAGSLDAAFGSGGKTTLDRILVPLLFNQACVSAFVAMTGATGLVIQPDGKYVVSAGSFSFNFGGFVAAARFGPSGSLDTDFAGPNPIWPECPNTRGVVLTQSFEAEATGIALQSDGRIVIVGNQNYNQQVVLVRLLPSGAPDASFGTGGLATYPSPPFAATERGYAIAVQPDGKIVVAGSTNFASSSFQRGVEIKRYKPDGTLDALFGSGGTVTTWGNQAMTARAVAIDSRGNIVVAGCMETGGESSSDCWTTVSTSSLLISRYKSDGALDQTFGTRGLTATNFSGFGDSGYAVALQPDGRIVAAGFTTADAAGKETFAIVRVLVTPVTSLAVDFGSPYGIWILGGSTWTQLNSLSPIAMATGDLDGNGLDDLIVSFGPGRAMFAWMNHATWTLIHTQSPGLIVTGDLDGNGHDDLLCVFPGLGLWRWSDGVWSRLHGLDPTRIAVGNLDGVMGDELVVDFPGYGLYIFANNTTWTLLHAFHANALLTADLDGNARDDVVIDFGAPYGLWVYRNNTAWTPLHGLSPKHLAAGNIDGNPGSDLVIDFGGPYGIWTFRNNLTWVPLHPFSAEDIVLGDRDGSGRDEIIIDFGPGYGVYEYSNDSTWRQLHVLSPKSIVAGRFY